MSAPIFSKSLALWEQWSPRATPEAFAPGCAKCTRGEDWKEHAPLLEAQAQQGGFGIDVLVYVDSPTMEEQRRGQPFTSFSHRNIDRQVRDILAPTGQTHRMAYAVKCRGSEKKKGAPAVIAACRAHARYEVQTAKPKRVLVLGTTAIRSFVGQYVDVLRIRRGWTYVDGVPVFLVMDTFKANGNRFYKAGFASALTWALTCPIPEPIQGVTRVLTTGAEVEAWLKALDPKRPTAVDAEHVGTLWSGDFRLLCLGMCQDPTKPVVLTPEAVEQAKAALAKWAASPRYLKVNQNIKHDRHVLYRVLGVDLAGIAGDTMLASRLLDADAPAGLGPQSWLVGFGGYKEAAKAISTAEGDKDGEETKGSALYGKMPLDTLHAYNGRDGSATIALYEHQQKVFDNVRTTYDRLIGPAFAALAIVERDGMLIDPQNVRAYDAILTAREAKAKTALYATKGVPADFNPGSPLQVAKLLYMDLGLPVKGKTATGSPSTGKEVLAQIQDLHPVVPILLELAIVRKQLSTYGLPMLNHVSPLDGRIHTTFKLVRTLRLSSSEPNMQNVTTPEQDGDEGSWARGCFVAPKGHKLVNLDYGQMELRVAAMLSGDTAMAKAFKQGADYHTVTAAMIFGCKPEEVTKDQRRVAKTINFGLIYGQTSYGLAKSLGISETKAEGYIKALFGKLHKLNEWRTKQIAAAQVNGTVRCSWDPPGGNLGWVLKRPVWDIGNTDKSGKAAAKHAENVVLNTPVQGIANLFSLAALTEIVRWTQDERPEVKVVMTVHDSIVLEAPDHLVDETARTAKAMMLQWPSGVVGLHVDVEVGQDWGHLKPWKDNLTKNDLAP